MWCEAEMREIEVAPARPAALGRPRGTAGALRRELAARNLTRAHCLPHQVSSGAAVVYRPDAGAHGNFMDASYQRILARPEWSRRLRKAHTSKRQGAALDLRSDTPAGPAWCELDSANSSDALLMNIFCYPRVLAGDRLPKLLGVARGLEPVFGFKPRVPMLRGRVDATEIDMRLGGLMVEAKLTEASFAPAPLRKLERYRDLDAVFERDLLLDGAHFRAYQLVRGVLAAHATGESFCLLCDARRPELVESWHAVLCAVRSYELRARLKLLTWQEVAGTLPGSLQKFLDSKYGIDSK